MAWQMPGQWNPGVAQMTPDVNMGSYTPEQWALMQQQNWQQWTQWQQQYSQWQSQYGEKYAEQMQSMQAMGVMPPLPAANSAPPPAPPPPEKPPPPPHENNQPLFGQPTPVQAPGLHPQAHSGSSNNISIPTGNTQNWQQGMEARNEPSQQGANVNTEALKKLAEEERLFDIQFEKWEEEIQKWKRENVNHPDRQAYNEYEQKFETCRAQLLERRQVMKQKRARLLGQTPPAAGKTPTGNTSTPVPPPLQSTINNRNLNVQPQTQNSATGQTNRTVPDNSLNNSKNNQQLPPNYHNKPSQNYQDNSQYAQYNNMQLQAGYNRNNTKNIDPQDRFESYQNQIPQNQNAQHQIVQHQNVKNENYAPPNTSTSDFLPGSRSSKGIPGLDLVPDDKAGPQQDVIDITGEQTAARRVPPDYTTISMGINHILGDEKIMNILSMVRDQGVPNTTTPNDQGPYPANQQSNNNTSNYNAPPGNQWERNQNSSNQQFENPPPILSHNQLPPRYPPNQGHDSNIQQQQYPPERRMNNDRENNMLQEPFYGRNNHLGQNMPPRGPPMRQNMTAPRPLMQDVHRYPDSGEFPRGPQRGGHLENRGSMRPNIPHPRPLIQGIPSQDNNSNNYARGAPDNRPMNNNMMNQDMNPGLNQGMNQGINPGMNQGINQSINKQPLPPPQPARQTWIEEPLFTPSIIVEYEHKPLRLKAREFIEPVHTFDYNHISKDGDNNKKKDFEREADELFSRKSRFEPENTFRDRRFEMEDMPREYTPRDFDRRYPRDDIRDSPRDVRSLPRDEYDDRRRYDERRPPKDEYDERRRPDQRGPPRDEYDDRRRSDERYDDRRHDDRDRYSRHDEFTRRDDFNRRDDFSRRDDVSRRDEFNRDRGRDREDLGLRDRPRDFRRDDDRNRSHSRDKDSRKRGRSKESTISDTSSTAKKGKNEQKNEAPKHVVMIDDLLEPPGREMRPEKIVIILRGPPGSGKSYLAKLIRDREAEHGGTARIMSIDDYFMQEGEIEEKDPVTGKMIKKPSLKYEYDASSEETYVNSLKRAFKRSLTDGYFNFLIYDAVNDTLRSYADIWNFARQNGFQVYICTMELDSQICFKRNIHGRTLGDVRVICTRFFPTPDHHIQLDATTLLQNAAITDVQMEDIDDEVIMEDAQETEVESSFTSKWEKMDDADKLARLDGTSKPLRPSQLSMADYLQLDDWKPTTAKPGKKSVRWADIEESREQEKMRAIGFVVGQTDWNRMTDPTMGSSALTQTKYIERVKRN